MEGLTTIQSNFGPAETMNRLEVEIKAHGVSIFTRINHAALAAEVGRTLQPTEVTLFGNRIEDAVTMQEQELIFHWGSGDCVCNGSGLVPI